VVVSTVVKDHTLHVVMVAIGIIIHLTEVLQDVTIIQDNNVQHTPKEHQNMKLRQIESMKIQFLLEIYHMMFNGMN
jgi:hypothetical protein